MQNKILNFFFLLAERHGPWLMGGVFTVTLVSCLLIPGLRISTSHADLLPAHHPEQVRYLEFLKEFGALDNLVVVLEGEPDLLKTSADRFAAEIGRETSYVQNVFYRIDLDELVTRGPLFADESALHRALAFLQAHPAMPETLSDVNDLASLLDFIDAALNNRIPGLELDPKAADQALNALKGFFVTWNDWLIHPDMDRIDVAQLIGENDDIPDVIRFDGYLLSHDQRMLFLFVQPASPADDASYLRPFRNTVDRACRRVLNADPRLKDGIRVAFTGLPAHVLTEVETIKSDVGRAGVISIVLVGLILLVGFRSWRKMLLAVVPLTCGMIITLAVIRLTVGQLNLISSSFLAVLFGIGIDFAIYLVRRVEEELGASKDRRDAVRIAVTVAGRGVMTGGLTTSLAFFAITISDFVGFAELGITAGAGVLVVLLTTFCLLPALLLRVAVEPRFYPVNANGTTLGSHGLNHAMGTFRWDLWAVSLPALLLSGCGILAFGNLEFDFNALNLLPRNAESTRYQLKMQDESDFQMTFAAVTADSLEELKALEPRLESLPTVSRVESLAKLIPSRQPEKIALLRAMAPFLSAVDFRRTEREIDPRIIAEKLETIILRLEDLQEMVFSSGNTALLTVIDENLNVLDAISRRLDEDTTSSSSSRTLAFQHACFDLIAKFWNVARRWPAVQPIDEDFFDPALRQRFKSPHGKYVTYVFPKESIWELDFLDRFVDQIKEISPTATGYPVTHRVNARLAVSGLVEALIFAFGMIVILLFLDFKRVKPVLLTLIPLAVGMLGVQVCMWMLGQRYNFASMAGLPLLLGLGVVYGVHIVHRWLEHPQASAFAAVVTSGRGVAFAALTTLSGLGSIVFARHNGVSSFGTILLMGILSCLLAALVVLPAVIDVLNPKRREGKKP